MAPGASHEGLRLPNPWEAVGRDTAAGRALFALYNGFGQARNRGNDYSSYNKIKTLKHIAAHGVPEFPVAKPAPKKKPEVKVPHFYGKMNYYDDICPVELMRGRRKASEILEQMREDSYVVEMPPLPKGPLLDAREKARLQEVFYWSNRNIGPDPPEEELAPPVRRPKKGSIEEQEMLLQTIAKEIEERETFMREMESYGKADKYRAQMRAEIQERVTQMKMLHDNITALEKKAVEAASMSTSSQPQSCETKSEESSHETQFNEQDRFERSWSSSQQQAGATDFSCKTSRPETTDRSRVSTTRPETTEHMSMLSSPCPTLPGPIKDLLQRCVTPPSDDELSKAAPSSPPRGASVVSMSTAPPSRMTRKAKNLTLKVPKLSHRLNSSATAGSPSATQTGFSARSPSGGCTQSNYTTPPPSSQFCLTGRVTAATSNTNASTAATSAGASASGTRSASSPACQPGRGLACRWGQSSSKPSRQLSSPLNPTELHGGADDSAFNPSPRSD